MRQPHAAALLTVVAATGCIEFPFGEPGGRFALTADAGTDAPAFVEHGNPSEIYAFADHCVTVATGPDDALRYLRAGPEAVTFAFDGTEAEAAKFALKASDLGTYLLYDDGGGYLNIEDGPMLRDLTLQSDVYLVDDDYVSGAEWELEFSEQQSFRYQLRHRRSRQRLGDDGLADKGAALLLEPAEGCAEHPEMSLDASGEVSKTTHDDGTLFGFADTHSHILTNFAFGGGGIAHGAPFHRLGVEHAMGDCELFHAEDGRADMLGWGFGGDATEGELDEATFVGVLLNGRTPDPQHATDGWPTFSDWPSTTSSTHQTQYYRWLERAWMGGLRLMVQHAVTNELFCELMVNPGYQPTRWGCTDAENVDRQLLEVRRMEAYIDAQWGGPGKGFFRVVESPAEAREVIADGKLAIVLGIEVPHPFDCRLTQREGGPDCNDEYIAEQLDRAHDLGVRVMFPNHKFDNAFTSGDGHRGIIELGNFITTSHWSNFVEDCPDIQATFDKGAVQFGGLNQPRDDFLADPPIEPITISEEPLRELLPYFALLRDPSLPGDWCQKTGLTEAGRTLIRGMMERGMLVELDHLPRRSYAEAFAMLEELDYPGLGTHGNTNSGKLYEYGGLSKANLGRCADPDNPGAMFDRFQRHRDQIAAAGAYDGEGFGFDLNGFAGIPGPRFGDRANCARPQTNPVEYPFTSFAGDVTFTEPFIGARPVDFNTEGMIHIGLVPELIEDARRTGVADEQLNFIFRSAEAYIRTWERAEAAAAALD